MKNRLFLSKPPRRVERRPHALKNAMILMPLHKPMAGIEPATSPLRRDCLPTITRAHGRNRTGYLSLTKGLLYRLSYTGSGEGGQALLYSALLGKLSYTGLCYGIRIVLYSSLGMLPRGQLR